MGLSRRGRFTSQSPLLCPPLGKPAFARNSFPRLGVVSYTAWKPFQAQARCSHAGKASPCVRLAGLAGAGSPGKLRVVLPALVQQPRMGGLARTAFATPQLAAHGQRERGRCALPSVSCCFSCAQQINKLWLKIKSPLALPPFMFILSKELEMPKEREADCFSLICRSG